MNRRRIVLSVIAAVALLIAMVLVFYSCGGGSGDGGSAGSGSSVGIGGVPSGSVSLYATDDLSDHKQVIATINKVTVMNTGSGASCDVLTTPTTINIANLSDVLQLLDVADCPAVPYNRLRIEFSRSVQLMDAAGNTSTCSFVSYKNEHNKPDKLSCSGDTCTLDVNGAVNVLVNRQNKVALDFRLKDFDVDEDATACSVTMKVSPIHAGEFPGLCRREAITGLVSGLTTSTHTFTLTKSRLSVTVLYSGITSSQQPGLNDLLQRAQDDRLKTVVTTSAIDCASRTVTASAILVKAEGLVSGLTTSTHTFILTYKTGTTIKTGTTMTVDYSKAVVKGALENNALAEAKLYGFDSASTDFLAAQVEVEHACTVPDGHKKEMDTED